MSLKQAEPLQKKSAEMAFREAFDRLKRGKPDRLTKGTIVSQNNVAKEAGVDPSALRKSRFPSLIAEIQRYVKDHATDTPTSARQTKLVQRNKNRDLREKYDNIKTQRDHLASLLNEANTKILDLSSRVAELEAKLPQSNIISIPLSRFKKE
jgi:hypothetical protein